MFKTKQSLVDKYIKNYEKLYKKQKKLKKI